MRTGVHYHPGHVWRILKRWGWSQPWHPTPVIEVRDPDDNRILLTAPRAPGHAGDAG